MGCINEGSSLYFRNNLFTVTRSSDFPITPWNQRPLTIQNPSPFTTPQTASETRAIQKVFELISAYSPIQDLKLRQEKGEIKISYAEQIRGTRCFEKKEITCNSHDRSFDQLSSLVGTEQTLNLTSRENIFQKLCRKISELFKKIFGISSFIADIDHNVHALIPSPPSKRTQGFYLLHKDAIDQERFLESLQVQMYNRLNKEVSNGERDFFKYLEYKLNVQPGSPSYLEILKGAYCEIDDGGETYNKWCELFKSKVERGSSHDSNNKQYTIRGAFVSECLFSTKEVVVNGQKKTVSWFQLERYPMDKSLLNTIQHLATYVLYKLTGKNQGPFGVSIHTEKANPLRLSRSFR